LRFDGEWNPDANAYARHGLVSGLTLLDAEDGHGGRERWPYLLLADELRRWSVKPGEDRRELFRRTVFNATIWRSPSSATGARPASTTFCPSATRSGDPGRVSQRR